MTMMMKIDLVVHADSDWEVDHIVVGVSEGLQNVFFGDKKRKSVLCSCIKLLCLVLFTFFLHEFTKRATSKNNDNQHQ